MLDGKVLKSSRGMLISSRIDGNGIFLFVLHFQAPSICARFQEGQPNFMKRAPRPSFSKVGGGRSPCAPSSYVHPKNYGIFESYESKILNYNIVAEKFDIKRLLFLCEYSICLGF